MKKQAFAHVFAKALGLISKKDKPMPRGKVLRCHACQRANLQLIKMPSGNYRCAECDTYARRKTGIKK